MAAFEVLSLDPAVPQIRAPGAGDTYSVPREMAISVNSATDALRITQTGAGLALRVEDSANPDATPFVVTADGNVGVGTLTPPAPLTVGSANETLIYGNIDAFPAATSDASVLIARTGGSGSAPFDNSGSLIYRPRVSSTAGRGSHIFYTGSPSAERLRINESGNVGIGTTTPETKLDVVGTSGTEQFRIGNTSGGTDLGINITENVGAVINSAEGATGRSIQFQSAGTNTVLITAAGELNVGGTTAVAGASGFITCEKLNGQSGIALFRNDTSISTGNVFGSVDFYGNDTTANAVTLHAGMSAVASGDHAAGDNPTDILFNTTPDGTGTAAEAGRITQAGSYVLKGGTTTAAAGVGIIFPATQVASANANSLDDYEEGTWTPVAADAATGGNASVTVFQGIYTKIGRVVTVTAVCNNIDTSGLTGANALFIRALPFVSADIQSVSGFFVGSAISNASGAGTPAVIFADNGSSAVYFRSSIDNTDLTVSDFTTGVSDITFTMTYLTST